ncbi:hypothetical protein [Pontibacter sp. G13]|uniref:hypothetical protein n=1 Tax=Pontibacter sp. G13 TaxID=3074898 RepID=UPI00288B2E58|nr:hypothetical protein [Pontibacter sp. G13]WNJ19069.1 hypothetical protein RJD25_01140 [Pontibacter sp. G13]
MNKRGLLHIVVFLSLFHICSHTSLAQGNGGFDTTLYHKKQFVNYGYSLHREDVRKGKEYFENGAQFFRKKQDTASYLFCMMALSDFEKLVGNFNGAFDILSDIEYAAYHSPDHLVQMRILGKYAELYGIYGQDSLALRYLNRSLDIAKTAGKPHQKVQPYFGFAQQYVNMQEYRQALHYLDSCYLSAPAKKRMPYVDALYGHIYTERKEYRKAGIYFRDILNHFERQKPAFIVVVYDYLADYHLAIDQPDSAMHFWQQGLRAINTMNVNMEKKPMILQKLSELHASRKQFKRAWDYMAASKEISDSLFHTQSQQNKQLFQLKGAFSATLSRMDQQIEAQQTLIQEQGEKSFRLQIGMGILLCIAIAAVVTFRIRTKMRQMALEQEKTDTILQIKNKELIVSTLQLIEKEQSIDELLGIIEEQAPERFSSLKNKLQQHDQKIWEDFHRRFTQTNSRFYEQLLKLHPSLTQNDLKHCALIKLKFDSKEMAQILGISVNSVHVSRSRIRKKLGLNRAESLGGYLEGI